MNIKDSYIHNGTAVLKDVKVENSVLKKILAGKDANDAYLGWETVCDLTGIKPNAAGIADKVGHKLTFSGGVTGTWDGSADKTVAIPTKSSWNYDDVYLKLTGGKITGPITFEMSNDRKIYINNSDDETYWSLISFQQKGTEYGTLGTAGSTDLQWNGHNLYHAGNLTASVIGGLGTLSNNITGNAATATNADLLDGVHYQNILERQGSGHSESGTATGWFRIAETLTADSGGITFLLAIQRNYNYTNNESYLFSISISYNGGISITQLSGYANSRLITKIRVDWSNSQIAYIDLYINASYTNNNYYWYTVGCAKSYTAWTANPTLVGNAYEFTTVNGCKSDRGFTGDLSGNATSATKLLNSRTIWGQSFDGTGNVSGAMTGVTSIEASGVIYSNKYNSSGNASVAAFIINKGSDYFGIGTSLGGVSNVGFGLTTDTNGTWKKEFMTITNGGDVGIGTTSPSYKLHVVGDIYTTTGFKKEGSSDSYVLLGGGGHKAISDFATASHIHSNYIERLAWWNEEDSHNANDLLSGTTFAYHKHSNCPTTGTIVAFNCINSTGYQLQLQGSYYREELWFRNRNGDNGTWNAWRYIIHNGNIGSQSVNYASSAGSATTSTYTSNVGSSGTAGTNYVTASKVISACNWYDTMIGSDSDTVINRWSEIVSFVAGFKETPDLATFLSNNYLAKAGGTMTGPLKWKDNNALPQQTSPQYFLCIDAFDNGGTTKWASKADTLKELTGLTSTAIGDSDEPVYWNGSKFVKAGAYPTKSSWNYDDRYLKLSGGTLTGVLHLLGSKYEDSANTGALDLANSDIYGVNSIKFADLAESAGEGLQWYRDATHVDSIWVKNGVIYFSPNRTWGGSVTNYTVWHSGNDGTGSGLDADLLDGKHASDFSLSTHTHDYIAKLRRLNEVFGYSSFASGMFPPALFELKTAGYPVYSDPEFALGYNSVYEYNNYGNGTVTITREQAGDHANSSGFQLKITTAGEAIPGCGGFHQPISSRANAIFVQIFRAKIPVGYNVNTASNSMGTNYQDKFITDRAGTGKWEWYARVVYCDSSGSFSSGGHVYLSANSGYSATSVTWYLSYCNVIDITKGAYDGLRTRYADSADSVVWSNVTEKPTTINGYGITDAYTKTQIDTKLNGYLPLSGGTLTGVIELLNNNAKLAFGNLATSPITGYKAPTLLSNGVGIYSRYSGGSDEGAIIITEDTCVIYNSSDAGWNFQVMDKDIGTDMTNDATRSFGVNKEHQTWSLGGFVKSGSSDSYVLLGGGGHKAESDLSVKYAISAGNATNANYFIGCTNTITVAGDSNTYYPVMVSTTANKKFRNIITVWKDLGSKTASYSGNHSNGTSSMLYRYDVRNCYWDGNGGYCTTLDARYMYAPLVSETMMLNNGVGNFCIWLRGGGTEYNISTSWNISLSDITVYYSSTNVGSNTYPVTIAPRTDIGNGGVYNNISIPCDVKYAYYAGNVAWNNITGKPATATRWPSWSEVTDKPTFTTWSETSYTSIYSLSNAAWTNTITLPTTAGSYILNIVSGNSTLTGVFSIGASDNAKDEISLHLHGNGPRLYARTNGTILQLSSNDASATSRSVTIKYRRMI